VKLNLNKTARIREAAQDLAVSQLWKTNNFYKLLLDTNQLGMLAEIKEHRKQGSIKSFVLASRRIGKSVFLCTQAVHECLSGPNKRVLYLSKLTENLREIIDQGMTVVLETCPEAIRPVYKERSSKFVFANGSEIRLKGLDKAGGDSVRGVKADLIIFDEACFMSDLRNLVKDIAMPMVIANQGYMLFGSSAPSSPGHESLSIIQECEAEGTLIKRTIYDCPRWSERQIEQFIREAGGKDTTTFRREYLCQLLADSERAILPAATADKMQSIVKEPEPLTYVPDRYVALDIGYRDLTVALFAYWDYLRGKLVIEDELVLKENTATTDNIAKSIREKEKLLWDGVKPYKRVSDTDPRLIADLRKLSGIEFTATKKDNLMAQVNNANIMVLNEQLEIHPRCKILATHMKYGLWNKQFTMFERSDALGHCDAVAALVYLIRNVSKNRNPVKEQPHSSSFFANTWQEEISGGTQVDKVKKFFGS
jgi:hypothetical protein